MVFTYVTPSTPLRDFARDYLIAHFVFDVEEPIPCKPYAPKPEQGITFFVRGGASMVDPLTGEAQKAPPATVFGQQVSRCNVNLAPEFLMFRVHFQPGALYRVLNVPLYEVSRGYFDAELVLNREVREVSERLAGARSYAEMVTVVEDYLLRSVSRVKQDLHPVDKATRCLTADPARFSLDWMADQACLSPRQLNRRFTDRMGVGPKFYSRLVRFYRAYRFKGANPTADWLTVAVRFGYTDYQHLAKDFRQFAQATPNMWIREDSASPEETLSLYDKRLDRPSAAVEGQSLAEVAVALPRM
jgi:AraC-like DNA-binding protein